MSTFWIMVLLLVYILGVVIISAITDEINEVRAEEQREKIPVVLDILITVLWPLWMLFLGGYDLYTTHQKHQANKRAS